MKLLKLIIIFISCAASAASADAPQFNPTLWSTIPLSGDTYNANTTGTANVANYASTTASANTTAISDEIARAIGAESVLGNFTQAGTGAVTRTVTSKLSDTVSVLDFGATPNDNIDDTAAIQAAINSLPAAGGEIIVNGVFTVSSTLIIGNGTNTSISSKSSIKFRGVTKGVGPGEYTSASGSAIIYTGPASLTTSVISVLGPIHSVEISDLLIDCGGLAGIGLNVVHSYQGTYSNLTVIRATYISFNLVSITGPLFTGVTQGFTENLFIKCVSRMQYYSTALAGFYMNGNDTNNIGFSRNTFINCVAEAAGNTNTSSTYTNFRGFDLYYVDNNTFIESFTTGAYGWTVSKGVHFNQSAVDPTFPKANTFINCPIIGGVGGISGTGGNLFSPYPTDDGELTTFPQYINALTYNGNMYGQWAGTKSFFYGRTDPTTGLTTSTSPQYFNINNTSLPLAMYGNQLIASSASTITALYVNLEASPGTPSRTFTLMKNGVATALSITFEPSVSGLLTSPSNTTVSVNIGDRLELQSSVTGSGALSNSAAEWSLIYYPIN